MKTFTQLIKKILGIEPWSHATILHLTKYIHVGTI